MARILVLLLVVGAAAPAPLQAGGKASKKEVRFEGTLNAESPKDTKRTTPCQIHVVPLKGGQTYVIHMAGKGFDAYLRLEDKAGKELDEDDDSGGNLDAQITFNCAKSGDYRIICTSVGNARGNYVLTVKARGAFSAAPANSVLHGKAAPDFQADFALNGKAGKLSDFKGKVVVLDFFTVHSGDAVAVLPRLRDLRKQYRDAGLEVVAVTYYNSELGHRLAFDAVAGKLIDIPQASKQTDQALLTAFAAYHKLEHPVLTLHKDGALKTFNEYLVNGLPQAVLIDRKGIVRATYAGAVQVRSADLENEIKKLLAEKEK
jgi:peroxiredoxin